MGLTRTAVFMVSVVMLPATARGQDQVIAVNADVPVSSVSYVTLKKILTGQITDWSDGQPIVLVLPPPGSSAMSWACKEVLKVPEDIYRRYLAEKVLRGVIATPANAGSEAQAAAAVADTAGAIAPVPHAVLGRDAKTLSIRSGERSVRVEER